MPARQYQTGDFYLGSDGQKEIGTKTERHAITVAGAGSGKGATVIIPNLKRWPHNALTIDPKGEAVEQTAADRERMGQAVHVLDPFRVASCPDRYRASVNPLDALTLDSPTIREDVLVIADGVVMRGHDAGSSHWDDGATTLIAGVIAYVLITEKGAGRNLVTVRKLIADKGRLEDAMEDAKNMHECGGLAMAAASMFYAKEGGYFVSNADKNTSWLDSAPIQSVLEKSTFSLSDLKHGKVSVYLVLPANYISQHGRFLRLFVRCALEAMAKHEAGKAIRDRQCLFLLDEFFALGYINEIAVSAGLMRGYGLQLWPILQDLGQLQKLYGREGMETFFGNADIHQFFGNSDQLTLNYISDLFGQIDPAELDEPPEKSPYRRSFFSFRSAEEQQNDWATFEENRMRAHSYKTMKSGKRRMPPDEIKRLVQKGEADTVARKMIVFVQGGEALTISPIPYFVGFKNEDIVSQNEATQQTKRELLENTIVWGVALPIALFLYSRIDFDSVRGLDIGSKNGLYQLIGFAGESFLTIVIPVWIWFFIYDRFIKKLLA